MQLKMADAEYFALERLSFSSLKYILTSPVKFKHAKAVPFKGNDATELGTAIHYHLQGQSELIHFEPDLSHIKTKAGVIATAPKMTAEGKALIEEAKAKLPKGAVLVPFDTKEVFAQIDRTFLTNPNIKQLMDKVKHIEAAHLGEIHGLKFKGKCDFEGEGFIIDLKSCGTGAEMDSFKRTIRTSHYDLQAAIYTTIKAQEEKCRPQDIEYYIIAVETTAPYEVIPYKLSLESLELGYWKLDEACKSYTTYIKNNSPYYREILTI